MEELPRPVIINGQPQIVDKLYEESYVYYNLRNFVFKEQYKTILRLTFEDPYDVTYLQSISTNPSAISGPYPISNLGSLAPPYPASTNYVQIVIPAGGTVSFLMKDVVNYSTDYVYLYAYGPSGVVITDPNSNQPGGTVHYFMGQWDFVVWFHNVIGNISTVSFVNTTTTAQTVYINMWWIIEPNISDPENKIVLLHNRLVLSGSGNVSCSDPYPFDNLWLTFGANTSSTITVTLQFIGWFNGNPAVQTIVIGPTNGSYNYYTYQYVVQQVNVPGKFDPIDIAFNYNISGTATLIFAVQREWGNINNPSYGYNVIYDTGEQTINASSTVTVTLYNVYPYYVNLKRIQLSRDSTNVGIYLYDQFGHQITGLYGTNPSGSVLLSDVTALYPYLQAVTVVVSNSDTVSHYYRVYAEGDYRQVILL